MESEESGHIPERELPFPRKKPLYYYAALPYLTLTERVELGHKESLKYLIELPSYNVCHYMREACQYGRTYTVEKLLEDELTDYSVVMTTLCHNGVWCKKNYATFDQKLRIYSLFQRFRRSHEHYMIKSAESGMIASLLCHGTTKQLSKFFSGKNRPTRLNDAVGCINFNKHPQILYGFFRSNTFSPIRRFPKDFKPYPNKKTKVDWVAVKKLWKGFQTSRKGEKFNGVTEESVFNLQRLIQVAIKTEDLANLTWITENFKDKTDELTRTKSNIRYIFNKTNFNYRINVLHFDELNSNYEIYFDCKITDVSIFGWILYYSVLYNKENMLLPFWYRLKKLFNGMFFKFCPYYISIYLKLINTMKMVCTHKMRNKPIMKKILSGKDEEFRCETLLKWFYQKRDVFLDWHVKTYLE